MLRSGGGEVVRGLGMAELLLALLELFLLLLPFFRRLRWKFFIKLACAGEKLLLQTIELWLPNGVAAWGLADLRA